MTLLVSLLGIIFKRAQVLGTCYLKKLKQIPSIGFSKVPSQFNDSLKELKTELVTIFVSSFFAQDKRFCYVGAVDNGHFLHSVARQIVVNHLKIFMNNYALKLNLLPKDFNDKKYWVEIIQKGGCRARLLLHLSGYGSHSFPLGSSEMLSVAPIFSKAFKASILEVEKNIKLLNFNRNFSIHDFQEDAQVKNIVENATKNFKIWFENTDDVHMDASQCEL